MYLIVYLIVPGLDTDKNPIESTPVISPEGKVEAVNEEMPTENGNNNITDTEKVDQDEVAPEVELSALVNYIQPVHFKSFENSESEYDKKEIILTFYIPFVTPGGLHCYSRIDYVWLTRCWHGITEMFQVINASNTRDGNVLFHCLF